MDAQAAGRAAFDPPGDGGLGSWSGIFVEAFLAAWGTPVFVLVGWPVFRPGGDKGHEDVPPDTGRGHARLSVLGLRPAVGTTRGRPIEGSGLEPGQGSGRSLRPDGGSRQRAPLRRHARRGADAARGRGMGTDRRGGRRRHPPGAIALARASSSPASPAGKCSVPCSRSSRPLATRCGPRRACRSTRVAATSRPTSDCGKRTIWRRTASDEPGLDDAAAHLPRDGAHRSAQARAARPAAAVDRRRHRAPARRSVRHLRQRLRAVRGRAALADAGRARARAVGQDRRHRRSRRAALGSRRRRSSGGRDHALLPLLRRVSRRALPPVRAAAHLLLHLARRAAGTLGRLRRVHVPRRQRHRAPHRPHAGGADRGPLQPAGSGLSLGGGGAGHRSRHHRAHPRLRPARPGLGGRGAHGGRCQDHRHRARRRCAEAAGGARAGRRRHHRRRPGGRAAARQPISPAAAAPTSWSR